MMAKIANMTMRRLHRRLLLVFGISLPSALILAISPLQSQTISVQAQTVPITSLTVNDLDFLNATTPKLLFTILMTTQGTVQAQMTITIDAILFDGSSYPGAVFLETVPFEINNSRSTTNLDLVNKNPEVETHTVREDAKDRLEETALPGGRVPAGMYRFHVTVTPVDGGNAGSTEFVIQPSNPTSLELRFPLDGAESATPFPLFQWLYDGPTSRLSIYEQLPGQSSLEETASGVPIHTVELEGNSYQYPSANARALTPGKTYVWLVDGLTTIAGGAQSLIRSEIRSFQVSLPGASVQGYSLLEELEGALGPQHKAVFDRLRAEGFVPEGTMSVNRSQISQSELFRLLNLFRSNPDAVIQVELE
jgi:hypothetical protein